MTDIHILRAMVKGAYDLQLVRMQTGIRLVDNFRAKLGLKRKDDAELDDAERERLEKEAADIIEQLRASYKRLTDGIARHRTLPDKAKFKGDDLISTYPEIVLNHQYFSMEKSETQMFASLEHTLNAFPVYTTWLRDQRGVGPAMAGVLLAYLDPHKARHISSFWKYAGLDVGPDNRGRSRRAEHLVERSYTDKNGAARTRMGITYEPFLKTKLMGVLAGNFLRSASPWRQVYDDYKHRLQSDAAREKCTVAQWKKRH